MIRGRKRKIRDVLSQQHIIENHNWSFARSVVKLKTKSCASIAIRVVQAIIVYTVKLRYCGHVMAMIFALQHVVAIVMSRRRLQNLQQMKRAKLRCHLVTLFNDHNICFIKNSMILSNLKTRFQLTLALTSLKSKFMLKLFEIVVSYPRGCLMYDLIKLQ